MFIKSLLLGLLSQLVLTVFCDDHLEKSREITGSKREESEGILSKYGSVHIFKIICYQVHLSIYQPERSRKSTRGGVYFWIYSSVCWMPIQKLTPPVLLFSNLLAMK